MDICVFFYPKTRKKKLKVIFKGVFKNKKLKLIEEYFEDNLKTIREWEFEKVNKNKFFFYLLIDHHIRFL